MNCCINSNSCLWILIILLILGMGGNVLSSRIFCGCGVPVLIALLYCMYKNGALSNLFGSGSGCDCGCGCNN